jgi:uncharacterized UPF0160 family protein
MHKIERSLGTHDGAFHADEVTACALLVLFDQIDRSKVMRSRDKEVLALCDFVCDVGGVYNPEARRFDHHQAEYADDLSSAGMVLLYLRDSGVITPALYDFFNESLVMGVDAHDTGRVVSEAGTCTCSHVIANFVPPAYDVEAKVQEEAFYLALDFALGHLKRLLEKWHYIEQCEQRVAEAMHQGGKVLVFDHAMPWIDSFFNLGGEHHPALFVLMPSGAHWKVRGIPPNGRDRMKVRMPLPQEWAGRLAEELQQVSGIPGAIFCHKGRFISIWSTKEDALKALNFILGKG